MRVHSWEVAGLDFYDKTLASSLRQILMSIKANTQPKLSLFHSVDKEWNGNGHVFVVLPALEQEARSLITGLLPYLHAVHPDHHQAINRCFTPEAVARAQTTRWDLTHHSLITDDDSLVQDILDEDDGFTLAMSSTSTAPHIDPIPPDSHPATTFFAADNDSVSTLHHSTRSVMAPPPPRTLPLPPSQTTNSTTRGSRVTTSPQASTISSITIEERLSHLETKLDRSLATMLANLTTLMQVHSNKPPNDPSVGLPGVEALSASPPPGAGSGP